MIQVEDGAVWSEAGADWVTKVVEPNHCATT